MRQLLSEVLRFAELDFATPEPEPAGELVELVHACEAEESPEYYAVDSGYAVYRVGSVDVLLQSLVAVGRDVRRKFILRRVEKDHHLEARENELRFAESIGAEVVLVDGPLTPYVNTSELIGVSKEPRLVRYGPRIEDPGKRRRFMKLAELLGEREAAGLLLRRAPRGSFLTPVDLGGLYGTFFKSDWVIYVEFPKKTSAERICALFKRYPIKLRLAHHLAKVSSRQANAVWTVLANVLHRPIHRPRELL